MQRGASYIKDSNDFINKVKNIDIPNDALLVTAVVGLYLSIPNKLPLKALSDALKNRNYKEIRARSLVVSDLRWETKGSQFKSGC